MNNIEDLSPTSNPTTLDYHTKEEHLSAVLVGGMIAGLCILSCIFILVGYYQSSISSTSDFSKVFSHENESITLDDDIDNSTHSEIPLVSMHGHNFETRQQYLRSDIQADLSLNRKSSESKVAPSSSSFPLSRDHLEEITNQSVKELNSPSVSLLNTLPVEVSSHLTAQKVTVGPDNDFVDSLTAPFHSSEGLTDYYGDAKSASIYNLPNLGHTNNPMNLSYNDPKEINPFAVMIDNSSFGTIESVSSIAQIHPGLNQLEINQSVMQESQVTCRVDSPDFSTESADRNPFEIPELVYGSVEPNSVDNTL